MSRYLHLGVAVAVLCSVPLVNISDAQTKYIYHWPVLSFNAYTSAQQIYYPNGDIDGKRAFYWGRALGSDGLAFTIRYMLPHLVEGNWQEPVYTSPSERTYIFDKIKSFQDTYAAQGCSDNFMQIHAHPPLYGESVAAWRAAVITGMQQKAELAAYAGFKRILIDLEFASQDSVSTDPQFWYDLGGDIMDAMRLENTDFMFGFYPGLYGYWQSLNSAERTNPRSIGTYPTESSIPEYKRNVRHALLEGIYSRLNGIAMWQFTGDTYSMNHLCSGAPPPTYVFNLEENIISIITCHNSMVGPGLQYMFPKWDIGRTQPDPIKKHWKQPNISLTVQDRNYDLIYQYSDYAGVWDDYGGWDEDGSFYLSYNSVTTFINAISGIGFESYYSYDTVTQQEHHIVVPAGASTAEKLEYFNIYAGGGHYHIQGKLADNFTSYVDTMMIAAGKDQQIIPLANSDQYNWALEYKAKGFFQDRQVVRTIGDPENYGYIQPTGILCGEPGLPYAAADLNTDCYVNSTDLSLLSAQWLESNDPANDPPPTPSGAEFILGYQLNEVPDMGPGGHGLYLHGSAAWDGSNYAPGGYSSQSFSCRGTVPRFSAVVGAVTEGQPAMSWVAWLKIDGALWNTDTTKNYYLFDGAADNWYGDKLGEFTCYLTPTNRRIAFEFVGAGGVVNLTPGSAIAPPEEVGVPLDTWVHLAVIFDQGQLTMYWNAIEKGTLASGASAVAACTSREVRLGASPNRNLDWAGWIDEFAIFDAALTRAEIQVIKDQGLAAFAEGATVPMQCSDPEMEYLRADINHDCYVNLADFARLASQWLDCINPLDYNCQ